MCPNSYESGYNTLFAISRDACAILGHRAATVRERLLQNRRFTQGMRQPLPYGHGSTAAIIGKSSRLAAMFSLVVGQIQILRIPSHLPRKYPVHRILKGRGPAVGIDGKSRASVVRSCDFPAATRLF